MTDSSDGGYEAVRQKAGFARRDDRVVVRVHGREPVKMMQGLITNDLAGAPEGQAVYGALLTPKGRMVADLRALRHGGEVLLELDAAAADGALAHLRRFVPPLFARFEDASGERRVLGVYGPESGDVVARVLGAVPTGPEDSFLARERAGVEVLVIRTLGTGEDGYDVVVPAGAEAAVAAELAAAGARPVSAEALEVLRIEAGRPRWGAELDEGVIPLEAGLGPRAISTSKGCYTGQEVIIRILHRGHVNRHLRRLRFGDGPPPAGSTQLFRPGDDDAAAKPVGTVTSACVSPRYGQAIGLGYVRREVEPPAVLRLGAPDGAEARVEAIA